MQKHQNDAHFPSEWWSEEEFFQVMGRGYAVMGGTWRFGWEAGYSLLWLSKTQSCKDCLVSRDRPGNSFLLLSITIKGSSRHYHPWHGEVSSENCDTYKFSSQHNRTLPEHKYTIPAPFWFSFEQAEAYTPSPCLRPQVSAVLATAEYAYPLWLLYFED